MKKLFGLLLAAVLAIGTPAIAAVGTIYVDASTGSASFSGTTDTTTATISGTAAAWTTATNAITLDTNTDFTSVSGCSAGTCDGSQAIILGNATNANNKIFWLASYTGCTGVGACTATVSGTPNSPTCASCSGSTWAIGGRYLWPSASTANVVEGALRGGDTVQFNNTPATRTATYITARTSGDATNGLINLIGKAGVRPKLSMNASATVITANAQSYWHVENLEFEKTTTGTSDVFSMYGAWVVNNVKITGTVGANGFTFAVGTNAIFQNSEVSGTSGDCIAINANTLTVLNNYIHNCGTNGIEVLSGVTFPNINISGNIVANSAGRGIYFNANSTNPGNMSIISMNTIYGNGNSGLEVTNANTQITWMNNILSTNGDAAGEYNAEWTVGSAQNLGIHYNNLFYHANCQGSNTGGPSCVSGVTLKSNELSSDPLLTSPGSGNFAIGSSSPAIAAAQPGAFITGSTSYLDLGAVQIQQSAGTSSTGNIRPGIN